MPHYRIGELARLAGVSPRTVDYYTRLGLVEPVEGSGKHRRYDASTVERIRLIKTLQGQRLSLQEIRERLAAQELAPDVAALLGRIEEHLQRLSVDLEDLRRRLREGRSERGAVLARYASQLLGQGLSLAQTLAILLSDYQGW